MQSLLEGVRDDLLTFPTVHLVRRNLHLLKEEDFAGQRDHLHGQGALAGAEEAQHSPCCYWGHRTLIAL